MAVSGVGSQVVPDKTLFEKATYTETTLFEKASSTETTPFAVWKGKLHRNNTVWEG